MRHWSAGGVDSRLTKLGEPRAVTSLEAEFEKLFCAPRTVKLSEAWIEAYRGRRRVATRTPEPVEVDQELEKPAAPPQPHGIQKEALQALEKTRMEGNGAGLVVLATGLGKTWLSAFDSIKLRNVCSLLLTVRSRRRGTAAPWCRPRRGRGSRRAHGSWCSGRV